MNDVVQGRSIDVDCNGLSYVGDFLDGKWHGHGTSTSSNGLKYVGEF